MNKKKEIRIVEALRVPTSEIESMKERNNTK